MRSHFCIAASRLLAAGVLLLTSTAFAQFDAGDADEEDRAQKINERFLSLVKRTPRFGTAFDRVYGFHVERGTLDDFVASHDELLPLIDDEVTDSPYVTSRLRRRVHAVPRWQSAPGNDSGTPSAGSAVPPFDLRPPCKNSL